jgi:hypothetical protein
MAWHSMAWQQNNIIEVFREHLDALHRGYDDAVEHVTISRQTIERSQGLLRLIDKIEAEQRPPPIRDSLRSCSQ